MALGYYSDRARRTGLQIEPHFFKPNVLERYRHEPYYEVTERRVSRKDGAPDNVERSMIQQYVWGDTPDGTPCVVVLLAHLCTLSDKDQDYWRLHELSAMESATAKIESRYAKPMLDGEFPDTVSSYDAIFLYMREIQGLFAPDTLFPNLDLGTLGTPDFLAPLAYNSKKAMATFAQDLNSLMAITPRVLARRIVSTEGQVRARELISRQQTRNLLHLYFAEHDLASPEITSALEAMRELNEWRVDSAHKLVPAEADQDYRLIQEDLTRRLQQGLRAMLVAFIAGMQTPPDSYRSYVLSLKV